MDQREFLKSEGMLHMVFVVIGWAVALFILTCNASPNQLINHHVLLFRWTTHPHFADLLLFREFDLTDPFYLFQKTGHFLGFSVLAFLLFRLTRSWKWAFTLATSLAVFTEIMQLYFTRDGRILDMGIDTLGILAAVIAVPGPVRYTKHTYRK